MPVQHLSQEDLQREVVHHSPFNASIIGGSLDLVITWLNSSNARWWHEELQHHPSTPEEDVWIKRMGPGPYNPARADLADTFVDLKYCLRSIIKAGLMRFVRRIHIVHSDLHPPPAYLNRSNPRVRFVPHSTMFGVKRRETMLPTFNRNAIDANFHRIPGLSKWFLRIDDDMFMMQPFRPEDLWVQGRGVVIHGAEDVYTNQVDPLDGGYISGMWRALALLDKRFGSKKRFYLDHFPTLAYRPALESMERLWPNVFSETANRRMQGNGDVLWGCFSINYLAAIGGGFYTGFNFRRPQGSDLFGELHTNTECPRPVCDGILRDVSDSGLAFVKHWLASAASQKRWLNIQGPGFDDAYRFYHDETIRNHSPKIEEVARKWYKLHYPEPSEFELKTTRS